MLTEPHQLRVLEEKEDLEKKIISLADFLETEIFKNLGSKDALLLLGQHGAMTAYYNILKLRIDEFYNKINNSK